MKITDWTSFSDFLVYLIEERPYVHLVKMYYNGEFITLTAYDHENPEILRCCLRNNFAAASIDNISCETVKMALQAYGFIISDGIWTEEILKEVV